MTEAVALAAAPVAGGVIAFLLGSLHGRRRRVKTTCSCWHARAFHKGGHGPCARTVYRQRQQRECECDVYDGPAPLEPPDHEGT